MVFEHVQNQGNVGRVEESAVQRRKLRLKAKLESSLPHFTFKRCNEKPGAINRAARGKITAYHTPALSQIPITKDVFSVPAITGFNLHRPTAAGRGTVRPGEHVKTQNSPVV